MRIGCAEDDYYGDMKDPQVRLYAYLNVSRDALEYSEYVKGIYLQHFLDTRAQRKMAREVMTKHFGAAFVWNGRNDKCFLIRTEDVSCIEGSK